MSFINFTNHNAANWSDKQIKAANEYGSIIDLPFPAIDPDATDNELIKLAIECAENIISYNPVCVLCQGETVFTCLIVSLLKANNIKTVAATSSRRLIESTDENGRTIKKSVFEFVKFREYMLLIK